MHTKATVKVISGSVGKKNHFKNKINLFILVRTRRFGNVWANNSLSNKYENYFKLGAYNKY